MPRNSSGVYALPPSNPVVANTVIATSWANPTMSDLAAEISNSLDRTGLGGMLAPFKIADGTIAAPGLAFTNEPGTGWYRPATGEMSAVVGSTKIFQILADRSISPVKLEHRGLDTFKSTGNKSWKADIQTNYLVLTPSATVNGEDWNTAATIKFQNDGSLLVATDLTVGRDFNVVGDLALAGTLGVSSISSAGGITAAGDIVSSTVAGRLYANGGAVFGNGSTLQDVYASFKLCNGSGQMWRVGMNAASQFAIQKTDSGGSVIYNLLAIPTTNDMISVSGIISSKFYGQTPYSANITGSVALDFYNGQSQILTITGNTTISAINNVPSGTILRLNFLATNVGTVTWPGTVVWTTGSAPSLSSGTAKKAVVTLLNDGSGSLLASYSVW